jgi:SH3-like domain-containing protein/opacity protein-like surface antigen
MRGSFAVLVVVLGLVVGASSFAAAETVVATGSGAIYLKPGESSKVVTKIKSGEELTVLRREGRWIKVRVRGRTGFIPRTKVSGGEKDGDEGEEPIERQTRRRPYVDGRSTDRGWGGEPPEDRRAVDAVDNVDAKDPVPPRDEVRERPEPRKPPPEDPVEGPAPKAVPKAERKPEVRETRAPREAKATPADDDDEPTKTSERPRIRLSKEASLRAKPAASSMKVATVDAGEYFLVEERPGWAHIESEDGERGWVSSKLIISGGEGGGRRPSRRLIAAGAQLGYTSVVQGTRTTGGAKGVPDNYNLSTSGVNVRVDAMVAVPVKKKFYAGGELVYVGTKALPGIVFMGKTTGISMQNLDVRAVGGYRLGDTRVVWGHLGYHYDMFSVANVADFTKNTAKLPSESLSGLTVGVAFSADRVVSKLGVNVGLDALLGGSRSQTKNLEDGTKPSATALWASAGASYPLTGNTTVGFGYRLAYVSNSFGGPPPTSMRGHTGGVVSRTDVCHALSLGVSQAF